MFCVVDASYFVFCPGVDKDGVYTQKHVGDRELEGDRDLRGQVSIPKDLCVALTQETDGSVFNALKVRLCGGDARRFKDVAVCLVRWSV